MVKSGFDDKIFNKMTHEQEDSNGEKKSNIWTTVFEINPDAFLEVQRILDTLRYKSKVKIDPKAAEEEAKELFGDES